MRLEANEVRIKGRSVCTHEVYEVNDEQGSDTEITFADLRSSGDIGRGRISLAKVALEFEM
ncbi:MAG TPA: hypothetical protein VJK06_01800 [Methyloceanibacter sp.]|nr:hypothetical protein [Methyloceanibacter sp.]